MVHNTAAILFVDDEISILNSLRRLFIDTDVAVTTASSALEALDLLRGGHFAVIVSDNLMPGMNGIDFLQKAKEIAPDSVRILLTAHADMKSAIDAINKGEVFRFITKPWDDAEIKEIVSDALNKYSVVKALKRADEATLLSLAQTIELKDPYTRGHCDRVARYAMMVAGALNLGEEIIKDIKHGSWLHDCGKIGVPENILNYNGPLSDDAFAVVKHHPQWGADVARQAQLSQRIVNVILYHHERYDGKGYLSGISGDSVPLEARIVSVADVYDALTTDRPYRKGYSHEKAMSVMESAKGKELDPALVDLFCNLSADPSTETVQSEGHGR
ncbi:MAG: response regulator [Nitrospirae bacterium]|nr:response regulator [Nitrospirota bacterium]